MKGRLFVIRMRNQVVVAVSMSFPAGELGVQKVLDRFIGICHRCNGGASNPAYLTINMEIEPLTLKVEIPSILHCLNDQVVKMPNVESGGIVKVDDLEDCENGVFVVRHQMSKCNRFEDVKAFFIVSELLKRLNVDLEEDCGQTHFG